MPAPARRALANKIRETPPAILDTLETLIAPSEPLAGSHPPAAVALRVPANWLRPWLGKGISVRAHRVVGELLHHLG